MHNHSNTRLTQKNLLRLVNQHLQDRRPLAEHVAEAGISLHCAYKWLAATAQTVRHHWRIDAVFATPSGGRSILSNPSAS